MAVYGDITPTQAAHSAKELLKRAISYMVLEQIGNLKALPSNSTKTINFRHQFTWNEFVAFYRKHFNDEGLLDKIE